MAARWDLYQHPIDARLAGVVGGAQALGLAVDGRVRVAVQGPVVAFPAPSGR